ncbi:MAG TPA: hypothetical protein DCS12_08545 [Clostridiales bacterium]|nr:hypothetical protein [Clostridiales bacterium]
MYNVDVNGIPFGKPIPISMLEMSSKMNLPKIKSETTVFPDLTPLEAEEQKIETKAKDSDTKYRNVLEDIGVIEGKESEYAEELGATKSRQEYKKYSDELTKEKRALETEIRKLEENPEGMSSFGLQSTIANIERKSLQKQADLAILGNMALGNYNEALSIAKEKVESELKPLTRQLEYLEDVRETNKDLLTTSQKAKLNSLYADVEREKNKEEERLTKGNEMIINAIQSGAPSSVVESAKGILNNGGNVNEIAGALGSFSLSPDEQVALKIKKAQLAELNQKVVSTTGSVVKPEDAAKIETYTDIARLASELKNMEGKSIAVGPTTLLSRIPGTQAYNFRQKTDQLINTLAAGNLDKLKGAMSDKDIVFLQKINTSLDLGMSEKAFNQELDRIYNTITGKLKGDYGVDFKIQPSDLSNEELIDVGSKNINNSQFFNNIKL